MSRCNKSCKTYDTCKYIDWSQCIGDNITVFQQFVGFAPTVTELLHPNFPSSGYRSGEQAYQKARGGISKLEYIAERDKAFDYFTQRFLLPETYQLVPVNSYIDYSFELTGPLAPMYSQTITEEINTLGLPLYFILDAPPVDGAANVLGYYRPEVICDDLEIVCSNISKHSLNAGEIEHDICFKKAIIAEHIIYMRYEGAQVIQLFPPTTPPIIAPLQTQITPSHHHDHHDKPVVILKKAHPSDSQPIVNGVLVPPKVAPQYLQYAIPRSDIPFFQYKMARYGYLNLLGFLDKSVPLTKTFAEIEYRTQFLTIPNTSSSFKTLVEPPNLGPSQSALYAGFAAQTKSLNYCDDTFEGDALINSCRDIRGNVVSNYTTPFGLIFDNNGGYLIKHHSLSVIYPYKEIPIKEEHCEEEISESYCESNSSPSFSSVSSSSASISFASNLKSKSKTLPPKKQKAKVSSSSYSSSSSSSASSSSIPILSEESFVAVGGKKPTKIVKKRN